MRRDCVLCLPSDHSSLVFRYGRYIEPLLSLSIDFYCRVYVRVRSGQKECKMSTSKLGHVYQCTGCESLAIQPLGKLSDHR